MRTLTLTTIQGIKETYSSFKRDLLGGHCVIIVAASSFIMEIEKH